MNQFFKAEKVTDTLTRIYGVGGEMMYLAVGSKRALLVDTGVGLGSLKDFTASLTDKPVTVVMTHGHVDHAFGAAEFDDVYMSHLDDEILHMHSDIKGRMGYCQGSQLDFVKELPESAYMPAMTEYKELKDGDVFDLGAVTAEIYELPGHTAGSMTVLFKEDRLLLTGDACNPSTFLFFQGCPPLEEYREYLVAFKARMAGKYDHILISHAPALFGEDLLDTVIDACDRALAGTADDQPMEFMGNKAYVAVAMEFGPQGPVRRDGKAGNILYNKENLFKKQ